MLSSLFSPYLQKFNRLPIYFKVLAVLVGVWLMVMAWPVIVAGGFSLVVFSTMNNPKTRYALAAAMLVPALVTEGYWASSVWGGLFGGQEAVATKPSQVALADHNNQIQGAQSEQTPQVRVVRAISGDVIVVEQQGEQFQVQLAGIKAPQPGAGANAAQCFGDESMMFLNSLLENRMIEVIPDSIAGDASANGDLLRYVRMSDGTKVNELMLEAGLARADEEGDYEQKDIFIELAESANQHNKGLWASCADDGQPKVTPAPTVVATPTPRAGLPEPTGVTPIDPEE